MSEFHRYSGATFTINGVEIETKSICIERRDDEPEPIDMLAAAHYTTVGECTLDAALSYLAELRAGAAAADSNYRDMWNQVCGQIGEMCEYLGVNPKEQLADAWTLRDEIVRLKAERDRFATALEELGDGACNSKYGPGCDAACKRVAWRALNP